MDSLRMTCSAVVVLGIVACGPGVIGGAGGTEAAVASTPLAGTINGRAFTAATAIASKVADGTNARFIAIDESPHGCDHFFSFPEGSRRILLGREWMPMTQKINEDHNILFQPGEGLGTRVTIGRLELIDTPTGVGQMGTLRLRAVHDSDMVEGQVSVLVCD